MASRSRFHSAIVWSEAADHRSTEPYRSLDIDSQKLPGGIFQVLLNTEVPLANLNTLVTERQLDLLDRDFTLGG